MPTKIFLTGATGYVGGTALDFIHRAHPDWEYTVLVRDKYKAEPISLKYPGVKFAYGSLDDAAILEAAAAEADVVIHTADSSDNIPGATAIAKGLEAGHTPQKPGYWIHLTGTGILMWYDSANPSRAGEGPVPEQKYHDINDVGRLTSLPDEAFHRDTDKVVLAANSDSVKIAMLCPPTIYSAGSGAVNTRSLQTPALVKATITNGFAPVVGAGKTEWDNVNVNDLGDLYVKLVDATQDPEKSKNSEIFGPNAYYFAENATHKWADVAQWVADEVNKQGLLKDAKTKSVSMQDVRDMNGDISWGQNSKGVGERARKYLGWKPTGSSLKESIADLVKSEAERLGLTKQAS